jgi:putative ABC transport system ATP-binding protein
MLIAKDISRAFPVQGEGDFYALKNVNLKIEKNRLTVLVGKSGSGKTTLMNIMGALDAPTKGEIAFEGAPISGLGDAARGKIRRAKMGYVFQSVALIPIMTAEENVMFALRLAGQRENMRGRALECLRMVGLSQRANHMPQELSGGEQQRVAIARAIAHRPALLFADEPTAELDSNTAVSVARIFRELVDKEGVTVALTTHDSELSTIGDKIYQLEDGEIIAGN